MKSKQLKDTLVNIWKQRVSYISICLIVMLGVTSYLGINYSAAAMKETGHIFYEEHQFQDMEMVATLGIFDEDIEAVRNVDGVSDAEGIFSATALVERGAKHYTVNVYSMTERLNQPELIEGVLPSSQDECAMEEGIMEKLKLSVGDTVSLHSNSGKKPKYLNTDTYTITAKICYADHVKEASYINSTVLLTKEAFHMQDEFDPENGTSYYTKMAVRLDGGRGKNTFDATYFSAIKNVEKKLQELSEERSKIRDRQVEQQIAKLLSEKEAQLTEARTQLDEAKKQLADGQRQLEEAKEQLLAGEKQLEEAKKELESGKAKLDEAKPQLEEANKKLADAKALLASKKGELDVAKEKLDAAALEIAEKEAQIVAAKEMMEKKAGEMLKKLRENGMLDTLEVALEENEAAKERYQDITTKLDSKTVEISYEDADSFDTQIRQNLIDCGLSDEESEQVMTVVKEKKAEEYQDAENYYREIAEGHQRLEAGKAEYEAKKAEYEAAVKQYNDKQKEYDDGLKEYEAKKAEYEAGLKKYEDGQKEFEAKQAEYDAAKTRLEEEEARFYEKQAEFAKKQTEYEEAEVKFQEKKQKLENVEQCKWFQFDRRANAGYLDLDMNAGNLSKLGGSFALLFVLVGAMVCYATIGRMVDEQRNLVGAMKALGFYRKEILRKYLIFGLSAAFLGIMAGILLAYFGLQKAILHGYAFNYTFGEADKTIQIVQTIVVACCGLLLVYASTRLACAKLLRTEAVLLMKQRMPAVAKKRGGGRKGSLYSALILNNMRSDLKRVMVTIVSVAGCCALLVIGFTLKSSVDSVIDKQFGGVVTYDDKLVFNPDASKTAALDLENVLSENGTDYIRLRDDNMTYQVTDETGVAEVFVVEPEALQGYYNLMDAKTGKTISPDSWKDGVLIQKRVAEVYHLSVGDTFVIYDSNAKTHEVKVAGIFNNYISRTMMMGTEFYEKEFGIVCRDNCFFVQRNGVDRDALKKVLSKVKGYTKFVRSDSSRELFTSISVILNAVIAGMIFMAAMMASVVLLNLANMYINQKKQELTIMRINGFTIGEVIGYLVRETVVTTILGIVLGIAGGSALAYWIIRSLERLDLQLVRSVSIPSWCFAALITIVFTVVIYAWSLRKVRHLSLTDMT